MQIPSSTRILPGRSILRTLFASAMVLPMVGMLGFTATAASASTKASPSTSATSRSKAMSAFTSCLASHGVKLPAGRHGFSHGGFSQGTPPAGGFGGTTPGTPPAGGSGGGFGGGRFGGGFASGNSKTAKAFRACQSKLPKGGFLGGNGAPTFKPTAAQQAALTKFDQCMSTQGVKVATNSSFTVIRSLMTADPAAAKACQSDLSAVFARPGGPPAPGTTPST
jgi:hypothetical protein